MKVPSKWATIVVRYGEKEKHLYADGDYSPGFFATEAEAQESAEAYCRHSPDIMVAVVKVERMLRTRFDFEMVKA